MVSVSSSDSGEVDKEPHCQNPEVYIFLYSQVHALPVMNENDNYITVIVAGICEISLFWKGFTCTL